MNNHVEGSGEDYTQLVIRKLPGRIIQIGNTKYTEEFFLAIESPEVEGFYKLERRGDITTFTQVSK